MQLLTHALAGWVGSNVVATTPKERLACIAISLLPDVDGLGLLLGPDWYFRWHHVLAHNLLFGALASVWLCAIRRSGVRIGVLYLSLFHLHLAMDLAGSGQGWGLSYLWPFSPVSFVSSVSWGFRSWQNYLVLVALVVVTAGIARAKKRTPLELIAPRLNAKFFDRTERV